MFDMARDDRCPTCGSKDFASLAVRKNENGLARKNHIFSTSEF
jgi:hypothetical protein